MPEQEHLFESVFAQAAVAGGARKLDRALELYDKAVKLKPLDAETHYKRANILKDLGRLEAAVAGYNQTITLKPDHSYAYCNRGVVLHALGLRADAFASYQSAIFHDPRDVMALYNCALLMQDWDRWSEVLSYYDRAISIDPNFVDAHYNRALALLYCGDFEQGWANFEWRWKIARRLGLGELRAFHQPLWLGKVSIRGKSVLLHAEGGLGDTLQFSRYARCVTKLGAHVCLEIQPALIDLFSQVQGDFELVAKGGRLPTFDFHCPLMSLPLAFETSINTIPGPTEYLRYDRSRFIPKVLLQPGMRPRIGLAWSGNPNNPHDRHRSIPLGELLAQLPSGYDYYPIQRDLRDGDLATLHANPCINLVAEYLNDFMHTAAVCDRMDLIVSVDTSLAHLAGTLGKKTWILLPFVADWRWMRDRSDCPWYPSVKLYRQLSLGNWTEVLRRVAKDLQQEFPSEGARHGV